MSPKGYITSTVSDDTIYVRTIPVSKFRIQRFVELYYPGVRIILPNNCQTQTQIRDWVTIFVFFLLSSLMNFLSWWSHLPYLHYSKQIIFSISLIGLLLDYLPFIFKWMSSINEHTYITMSLPLIRSCFHDSLFFNLRVLTT